MVATSTTEAEYVAAASCCGQVWTKSEGFEQIVDFLNANPIKYALTIQALVDGKKVIVNEATIRRDLRLDKAEAAKEMGKIPTDTQDTPIVDQPSSSQPQKKHKSRRKQRKEIEVPHDEPQAEEHVPTPSNDPHLSGEDRMRMNEEEMFGVHDLIGDEVVMDTTTGENVEQGATVTEKEVSAADPVTTASEVVTTASIEIKLAKPKAITTAATTIIAIIRPKAIGVIVQEPSEFKTTPLPQPSQPKDKGNAIMVEPKRPLKRKEQIMMDEQVTKELKAQIKAELE
nr:hypothetical protein [Tanacetum cinerariifolium]